MLIRLFTSALFLLLCANTFAQTEDQSISISYIIIGESKSYDSALRKAQKASNKLVIPLNLRNYYGDKENGLKTSEICECGENHGYIARGRYDHGTYISVEHSKGFNSFEKNTYLIIIASGSEADVHPQLNKTLLIYNKAYIFQENVYMGCMH